jgi:hypothetical protein
LNDIFAIDYSCIFDSLIAISAMPPLPPPPTLISLIYAFRLIFAIDLLFHYFRRIDYIFFRHYFQLRFQPPPLSRFRCRRIFIDYYAADFAEYAGCDFRRRHFAGDAPRRCLLSPFLRHISFYLCFMQIFAIMPPMLTPYYYAACCLPVADSASARCQHFR